jgi:DeoR family suf operon transcriptional repressor
MTTTRHPLTKQDILEYLLKQAQATAQELAEILDITPQAIRRHLKELEADGLIAHRTEQVGMGRPNHIYTLSRQGREQFPSQYDNFAVSLLSTLEAVVGREQMSSILQQQWQHKAKTYREQVGNGSLLERVAALVELRKAEGYMAEWYGLDPQNSNHEVTERFMLTEHNCAIASIAESFPSVCRHELEMFAEVLSDCTVERTQWLINGEHRCGYLIQPRLNSASPH